MMINVGLLQEAWAFALEHPEQYTQDAWGYRNAKGSASETHDIAGLALKLIGAKFVWTPVADYPPETAGEAVWGCQDVIFSSLPPKLCKEIAAHCTVMPKDRYADYFWHSVTHDRCPIGLAARIALGIDSADALVLFEEDAKTGEIARTVAALLKRGRDQWDRAQAAEIKKLEMDQLPAEQVDRAEYLTACLEARGTTVKVVSM